MLALFSLLSMLSFSLVGGVVGWRILRLARRTGGKPERWIALCLLFICAIGYPIALVSQLVPPGAARIPILAIGVGAIDFGLFCVYLFTRSVFRPSHRWLRVALALPAAALAVHLVGFTLALWGARSNPAAFVTVGTPWALLTSAVSGLGFAWTGLEALAYWTRYRRRVALGLADALVVNRFLLWALVGLSTTIINAVNASASLRGLNVLLDPTTMIATGGLGLFNAVALWLAFLPPAAYARRIRRRTA